MSDITFIPFTTIIPSTWAQDINNVCYRLLGTAGAVPTTPAQMFANLGLTSIALPTAGAGYVGYTLNLAYAAGTVGDWLNTIANSTDMAKGVSVVGGAIRGVNSIAVLRTLPKTGVPRANVLGYRTPGDGGGGLYYYDSTDTTSADNSGTIIVAADGGRWKLVYQDLNVAQFGADMTGVLNSDAAVSAALTFAATLTSGGKGATVYINEGVLTLSLQVSVPDRVKLVGAGSRSTIINNSFAGFSLLFAGVTFSGISGVRLGLPSNAAAGGISITTPANVSSRWNTFKDIEIAAGALLSGQVGVSAVASGSGIVTENVFDDIKLFQVDQPWILTNIEGNFIVNWTADSFGAVTRTALACQGNANFIRGRIAGAPAAASVGYAETGARNIVDLVVDIGASSTALNITGAGNEVRLSRPQLLTPLGTFATSNSVWDSEFIAGRRVSTLGTTPTSAQFSLVNFGTTATVTGISGSDARIMFTVNSSGTGQAANPTINYAFLDGNWPRTPVIQVTRDGGNQPTVGTFGSSASVSGWGTRLGGTPVAGESYVFIVSVQ